MLHVYRKSSTRQFSIDSIARQLIARDAPLDPGGAAQRAAFRLWEAGSHGSWCWSSGVGHLKIAAGSKGRDISTTLSENELLP